MLIDMIGGAIALGLLFLVGRYAYRAYNYKYRGGPPTKLF